MTNPRFDSRQEALDYIAANAPGYEPYGLRKDGRDWYEVRPVERAVRPAQVAKPAEGKPTAKATCLALYTPGITRDDFVAAAVAAGVKEVSARTLYSDIKAGRVR